mmetsp:Transcript_28478/g.59193  ORF Transcript_28478/g.59193 Transcript_28478/m.59193 type:complete len:86 (+) Transcript_28478:2497-2754(+)
MKLTSRGTEKKIDYTNLPFKPTVNYVECATEITFERLFVTCGSFLFGFHPEKNPFEYQKMERGILLTQKVRAYTFCITDRNFRNT